MKISLKQPINRVELPIKTWDEVPLCLGSKLKSLTDLLLCFYEPNDGLRYTSLAIASQI